MDTGNIYCYLHHFHNVDDLFVLFEYRMEGELMRIAMEPLLYEHGVDVVLGDINIYYSRTYILFYGL